MVSITSELRTERFLSVGCAGSARYSFRVLIFVRTRVVPQRLMRLCLLAVRDKGALFLKSQWR